MNISAGYALLQDRRDVRDYDNLQIDVRSELEDEAWRFMGGDAGI